MRHLVKGRKLGRTAAHRKATLQALSVALIKEHRIVTTVAKAKELRRYFEPLVTRAKEDTSHNRRQIFSKLKSKEAVSHLFEEVAQKVKGRPGGYTRVIKAGFRKGDGAELAIIELVDYNDIKPEEAQTRKRTRRAGKSNKPSSSKPKKKKTGKKKKKEEQPGEEAEAEQAKAKKKPAKKEKKDSKEKPKAEADADADETAEESSDSEEQNK